MSVNAAVATLFSSTLIANLDPTHVYTEGCNTNHEGEIKGKGQTLKIFNIGRPTPFDYTVGATITYQRLRPSGLELHIDQDVGWAIAEDDLEAMLQSPSTFEELAQNGAWTLVDGSDQFLAFLMAREAAVSTSAAQVGNGANDDKAYDVIERMITDIKEASGVFPRDMHAFVPFWYMEMLRLDQRVTGFGTGESRRTMRGEEIKVLSNVTLHETANALDSAGTAVDIDGPVNTIIVTSKRATTWGRHIPEKGMVQFLANETNHENWDNRARSRYVYGATVVYPQLIAKCVVTKGN